MLGIGSLGWLRGAAVLALWAALVPSAPAAKESVEELKARLASTGVGDRVQICVQIAERQLDGANKLYAAQQSEQAQTDLTDVVTFSELARDYALQSHKRQKQTEIAVRQMTRQLTDLRHAVGHDEVAAVQNAIDHLQRVRDDLLMAMFPKGKK